MNYIMLNTHSTDGETYTKGVTNAYNTKDLAMTAAYQQCKDYMDAISNGSIKAWCVSVLTPNDHKRVFTQTHQG